MAEMHVCVVTDDHRLMHTIRGADGSWLSFGDVEGQAGAASGVPGEIWMAATSLTVSDELHVCPTSGETSRLSHTIRHADGSWLPFSDVDIGVVLWVTASATTTGELHVVALTHVSSPVVVRRLMHAIRRADGSWSPPGDVLEQTGEMGAGAGEMNQVTASATPDGELHVCVVTRNGRLMHTIRHTDGSWFPFGNVEVQTGGIGLVEQAAASATASGDLHVCVVTENGRLMHTMRRADESWLPFGSVEAQAGHLDDDAHLTAASVAGNGSCMCA